METRRPYRARKRRIALIAVPILLAGLCVPFSVRALGSADPNPRPAGVSNLNDVQDLGRTLPARSGIQPLIASGSDTISGKVVDASNGSPISGATVYLSDIPQPCNNSQSAGACAAAMQTATTDASGSYSFTGIGNGTYNLAASRLTSGSTMYPQTAPGVVPASNSNQQGVQLNVSVSGTTSVNFSLQPFAAPGSRSVPSGHAKNLIVVDFDETYARSWFSDSSLSSLSTNVRSFATSGVNNQSGLATYGWSPIDHYSIATGQYPYWRLWDPWPSNLCNWATSGNGGADCGIDTNKFYCSGSCVPEAWGQMSMFDVAKAYGMSTAVIGGSDYPTGHINNANVDSIQLGSNSQCTSAGASCQWENEAEAWITNTGAANGNGFLLYMPVTPAEGSTPESTSPDASGSSYQNAQQLDDQVFGDFRSWLSAHNYLGNTDMVVVADEAENDHTSYDNFYGTNTTKNVPMAFAGPDYLAGQTPSNAIHLDDIAATALGGLCLPSPAGGRGTVQTTYLKATCSTAGATATNTVVPSSATPIAATPTSSPIPATGTNTPAAATATRTPPPGATATTTPAPAATATNTPAAATPTSTPTGSCASDGTCLTGFTASATSVPVNTGVTLTATTNTDVGPTVWYVDIVNQSNAIVKSCSSGTTCSVSVTSATAATTTYTAYLSTSSSSITGGGPHSSSVTVSWTTAATLTPVPPTRTPTPAAIATSTAQPSATATPIPASTATAVATPTASGGFADPVSNGGFETGNLSGWTSAGVGQGGQPIASTTVAHSGSYSAYLGVISGSEPNGDNCLYQNESFSGTHTLSFYDYLYDINGDTITYDWQEAYYRPSGTAGCAETGTRLFKLESNHQSWYADSYSVTGPGQIYFNVHEDGSSDPTAMFIDDVSIH